MNNKIYWSVIGIVDSYGAVHARRVKFADSTPLHDNIWPTSTKRWRFLLEDWSLDQSCFSCQLTDEDKDAIMRKIEKWFTPPDWAREPLVLKFFIDHKGTRRKTTKRVRYIVLGNRIAKEIFCNSKWDRTLECWPKEDCLKIV